MIEAFVRLVNGEQETGNTSVWQGILTFQTNVSINQLVNCALQSAGRNALHIVDPHSCEWRFLLYNHKFGEYCDMNIRDKRSVCDGDKFELVYVTKNGNERSLRQRSNGDWSESGYMVDGHRNSASAIAEVQNQTPLVFLDDENNNLDEMVDVKPSLDQLIRATTSSVLAATERAISDDNAEKQRNGREIRRGSTRHLPSDLIRQLEKDDEEDELEDEADENIRNMSPVTKMMRVLQENGRKRPRLSLAEQMDDEDYKTKRTQSNNRRHSSIVSESSSIEDGPCQQHAQLPELCSHTKFKNVDALAILALAPSGKAIMDHLSELGKNTEPQEIEHGMRCKLMNTIGTFLMHNADNEGLPTAVERRILVHHFLAQLPCQLDTTIFTNRGGTGCLDYWVRNRRKTNVRDDGVYMVRGSKNRGMQRKRRSEEN